MPYIFAGTSFTSSAMAMNFESEIALLEMRKQRGTDTVDDRVKSSAVAEKAWEKMNSFIKAQTKLHSRTRRNGALGSHDADHVCFPLHFDASPFDQVIFKPLAIGWMESKGTLSASEYVQNCLKNPRLRHPARELNSLPLCPVHYDDAGCVLSVPPLSNGYESRTVATSKSILLECSSGEGAEADARALLFRLLVQTIKS